MHWKWNNDCESTSWLFKYYRKRANICLRLMYARLLNVYLTLYLYGIILCESMLFQKHGSYPLMEDHVTFKDPLKGTFLLLSYLSQTFKSVLK